MLSITSSTHDSERPGAKFGWAWFLWAFTAALLTIFNSTAATLSPSPLPCEVIFISANYVLPAQITRPAGKVFFVIRNHSNLKNLQIHVGVHGGQDIHVADIDTSNGNYTVVLDLQPGTYDVFEPGHPKLKTTLTITK